MRAAVKILFRYPEWTTGRTLALVFFLYSAGCVATYWSVDAVRQFIDGLEPAVARIAVFAGALDNFRANLPSKGQAEWVILTRHLYAASLLPIAIAIALHLEAFRARLQNYTAWIIEHRDTEWALRSRGRYAFVMVATVVLFAGSVYSVYIGGGEFDTRVERAWTLNPYIRLLLFLPFAVLSLSTVVPFTLNGLASLFSLRLFNRLS